MESASYWQPPAWGRRTYLMGIVNATPDSFSDGGLYDEPLAAAHQAVALVGEGADFIDVGAESTRPGATYVPAVEECRRLLPALESIRAQVSVPLSVDTYKAEVAREALRSGADIVNDIWGFQHDPAMAGVVAEADAGAVLMHNADSTDYAEDIIDAIKRFFERSLALARQAGVSESKLILDPGIGFGKTVAQNLEVLRRLDELRPLGFPLLLGVSRKSVIGQSLDLPVGERLEGTLALGVAGIQKGADILRVHDVRPNARAARLADLIYRA